MGTGLRSAPWRGLSLPAWPRAGSTQPPPENRPPEKRTLDFQWGVVIATVVGSRSVLSGDE